MKRSPLPKRKSPIVRRMPIAGAETALKSISGVPARKSTRRVRAARPRGKSGTLRFGGIPQNPKFLAFTRECPCILNNLIGFSPLGTMAAPHFCSGRIEAAHTGRRGLKQKAADETCLPMCCGAHRTSRFSHHTLGKNFWAVWNLSKDRVLLSHQRKAVAAGIQLSDEYLDRYFEISGVDL